MKTSMKQHRKNFILLALLFYSVFVFTSCEKEEELNILNQGPTTQSVSSFTTTSEDCIADLEEEYVNLAMRSYLYKLTNHGFIPHDIKDYGA